MLDQETWKRHVRVWRTLARYLDVNTKSLKRISLLKTGDLEFFTVKLPLLGKALDRGLQGKLELPPGFPFKRKKGTALPEFLYERFILIFHRDGVIRDEPIGIRDTRQLLMMFYKFEMPFDKKAKKKFFNEFIDRDKTVKSDSWPYGLAEVRKNFISLLPDNPLDIRPHHADGATADNVCIVDRYSVRRYIPSLMKVYGPKYFFNTVHHAVDWCNRFKTVIAEPQSKLALVPKDSRGPRLICMEPHERMFIQKGLMQKLYDHIELYSPAKGYINFRDQSINADLARLASIDGAFATIDLKDASDLVSWNLIRYLVTPEWYEALSASRTAKVRVPGYGSHTFRKYAPMGSALCFPIEAMLFWSIARTCTTRVWVYGDDIIVPTIHSGAVISALESYGLSVNRDKTLSTGFFRESCGGEYYRGTDISYIKCKSYERLPFIEFVNHLVDRYGNELGDKLVFPYEREENYIFLRLPHSYKEILSKPNIKRKLPLAYFTPRCSASYVFFPVGIDVDVQTVRLKHDVVTAYKIEKPLRDYDRFFAWLTSREESYEPESDAHWSSLAYERVYTHNHLRPVEKHLTHLEAKPEIKMAWGVEVSTLSY